MEEEEIEARIIEKLLRKHSIGGHSTPIDEVPAWFPSHQQQTVQNSVKKLLRDPDSPIEEAPGVAVSNIRLGDIGEAVSYLESRGHDVPWGYQKYSEPNNRTPAIGESATLSEAEDTTQISDLEEELNRMNEAARDWRNEARRRQRMSLLFGALGFLFGLLTSGAFQFMI